jgi:non-ribosomal peptide synthetase-like protein
VVTAILFLLMSWSWLFIPSLCWIFAIVYFPFYGMGAILGAAAASFVITILWMWFVERASLKFGVLEPKIVPVLKEYFWFHERIWKMTGLWYIAPFFSGTPMKNLFSRMEGVRLGKKVFDDGAYFDEYTLIEIGDYTTLNTACVIQPHSLEEAVFKSDRVKLGVGCTLGVFSNLHYGVTMGDYVVIEANAFVMKGEIVDTNTTWRGNPARAVVGGAVRDVQPAPATSFVTAKVA